jgi:hypothetical protein
MDNVTNCLEGVSRALDARGLGPGSITHTIAQLQNAFSQEAQGLAVTLEQRIRTTVTSPTGVDIAVDRIADVVGQRVGQLIHTEVKTGRTVSSALPAEQLMQDAALAIQRTVQGATTSALENVWRFTNLELSQLEPTLRRRMEGLRDQLVAAGFSPEQIRAAISSFNFVGKASEAIKVELSENGQIVFREVAQAVAGEGGEIQQALEAEVKSSPNFAPAMQVIFGPSGKLTDAAQDAAQGANLEPALQNLEDKIEEGVTEAMEDAGEAAAASGAQALGSRINAGATALGNVLTSVPQLYDSVTKLGEAWDKPLESTADYMNLFAAAGSTISQGVQTFQALAGVTQIASAAQAAFNAVMAMNPIVLIVLAVIALIAAIVALVVYWDQVEAAVRDNPWVAAIGLILGPIGILIGLIVLIIAYWDEVKLAVLVAANFISIQVQRIGQFFVGLRTLIGQVWDWVVATVVNVGISIVNTFITIGTEVQNFFIGLVNSILEIYNELATSAVGEFIGLEPAELIPEVELETRLIPPREVPQVSVEAAFAPTGKITGGLEGAIASQEAAVAQARAADEERRRREQEAAAQPPPPAAAPAPPSLPPAPAPGVPPAIPQGVAAAAPAGPVDTSVTVNGGITVNINAERLEADAAQLLSDELISAIQARLGALRAEQDFRTGVRPTAPA